MGVASALDFVVHAASAEVRYATPLLHHAAVSVLREA